MEMTVYNPQKGRLETIDVVITKENTTWFDHCMQAHEIYMITDFEGDLLVREFGYAYPVRIYDTSRADIGFDQKKAEELKNRYIWQVNLRSPYGLPPVNLRGMRRARGNREL